jgi:hypothetical protein
MVRVGNRFIDPGHIGIAENDTGGTGKNETSHTGALAGRQNILRPHNVWPVKGFEIAPHPGPGGIMEDHGASVAGLPHRMGISHVPPDYLYAQLAKFRIVPPSEAPHRITGRQKVLHDGPPQETASSGDKDLHT